MEIYYTSINAILSSKCIHAGTLFFFNYTGVVYVRLLYAAEVFITQPWRSCSLFPWLHKRSEWDPYASSNPPLQYACWKMLICPSKSHYWKHDYAKLSFVTWCCRLMSRRKKGALHGLNYFPSLTRNSSNTRFRIFPTCVYFKSISTTSNSVNVFFFILHKNSICQIHCLLPVIIADALNYGCKWSSVWLAVPELFLSCWLSYITLVL